MQSFNSFRSELIQNVSLLPAKAVVDGSNRDIALPLFLTFPLIILLTLVSLGLQGSVLEKDCTPYKSETYSANSVIHTAIHLII